MYAAGGRLGFGRLGRSPTARSHASLTHSLQALQTLRVCLFGLANRHLPKYVKCNALDIDRKYLQDIEKVVKMENINEIIECISDIVDSSNKLNIKSYVWGGYVQDIIEGKILREHKDIDMFIENMDEHIEKLGHELKDFKFDYHNNIKMLKLEKNGIKITINPIIFINETAIWKHIGEQGFINFPKNWLDKDFRHFYDIKVLTSGYKFEYCVRRIIKYMNPNWTKNIREKDIIANKYYENILKENGIKPSELLEKIWGYNPFWLKDGYNGYEAPVLVIGKEYI
jgi:hypothetical protein